LLSFFIVINRLTTQTWCIDNGFELVELDPDEDSDSETEGNLSTLLQLTFKKGASSIGQHLKKKSCSLNGIMCVSCPSICFSDPPFYQP